MDIEKIPFAPGYYVSMNGNIYSGNFNKTGLFKELKHDVGKKGYHRVTFHINKRRVRFLVHRLVAEVFIPNPNNLPIINHLDSNRGNNNVRNLEWSNQSKNIFHGIAKGNITPTQGEKHGCHLLTEKQVLKIRDMWIPRKVSQEKIALLFGVKRGAIKDIVERKTWRHI